jgi:SHS family lactate transporter-like MFS transporter
VLPALLVFYIRYGVEESPVWKAGNAKRVTRANIVSSFAQAPVLYIYAILLMAAFNFMSHGSQDLYPTFLQKQHGFSTQDVGKIAAFMNVGAILGGTLLGALSQRLGRRVTIMGCCVLGACIVPFWSGAHTAVTLALGAFALQFFVQGAWGVVPAHLNELSPGDVRGTFPGFTYQIGNLLTAYAAQWEAGIATKHFPLPLPAAADYGRAMALIMFCVFAAVFVLAAIGRERRGIVFEEIASEAPA